MLALLRPLVFFLFSFVFSFTIKRECEHTYQEHKYELDEVAVYAHLYQSLRAWAGGAA